MKLLFMLIQIASNKPVIVEAHPDCNVKPKNAIEYTTESGLHCINANSVFRDVIYRGGFESE